MPFVVSRLTPFTPSNKAEPGAVLSTKNHTGGIDGREDHGDGKIFSCPGSKRCPVKTIKAYLSHLNPEVDALFQRPKDESVRFSPEFQVQNANGLFAGGVS